MTMRITLRYAAALAALAILALTSAQEPQRARTLEERIVELERGLATIDTRFGIQSARLPDLGGESGAALAARVDAVERAIERLGNDLQRVDRLADTAARDAAQAQRDATAAQQTARDAALRTR
jgi:hypothetical protein